ncbi:MAG: 2-amino-4-hydroxy-6-hydroxymethyldihydropteridine diphosphokinase [Dehalococcoidia bacterium]
MSPEPRQGRRVWLALGGNLGDRTANQRTALDALEAGGVAIDAVSALYDTPPWGIEDQPTFANSAASGVTTLGPHALLALCKRIEADAGRDFGAIRNSARPIDIDVLLIEGEQVSAPDLEVPHAAMHERAFVLMPLADIAADVEHPRLEQTIEALLAALPEEDRAGVTQLEPRGWWRPGV